MMYLFLCMILWVGTLCILKLHFLLKIHAHGWLFEYLLFFLMTLLFALNYVLSDIKTNTTRITAAFFWFVLVWYNLFNPF